MSRLQRTPPPRPFPNARPVQEAAAAVQTQNQRSEAAAINGANAPSIQSIVNTYQSNMLVHYQPTYSFSRNGNDFINLGQRRLNIKKNGGFTVIVSIRFSSVGTWERIFDFAFPRGDQLMMAREGSSNNLIVRVNTNESLTCSNAIIPNETNIFVLTYNVSTRELKLRRVNGNSVYTRTSGIFDDSMLYTNCYIGKSNYPDAMLGGIMHYFYMFQKLLTEEEINEYMEIAGTYEDIRRVVPEGNSKINIRSSLLSTNKLVHYQPTRIFTRVKDDFVNLGSKQMNIVRNGGFTVIVSMEFSKTIPGQWERIYAFGQERKNGIFLSRRDTSQDLLISMDGQEHFTCPEAILYGENVFYIYYYEKTKLLYLIRMNDGKQYAFTHRNTVSDSTVYSESTIGKSPFSENALLEGLVNYMYIFDTYVDQEQAVEYMKLGSTYLTQSRLEDNILIQQDRVKVARFLVDNSHYSKFPTLLQEEKYFLVPSKTYTFSVPNTVTSSSIVKSTTHQPDIVYLKSPSNVMRYSTFMDKFTFTNTSTTPLVFSGVLDMNGGIIEIDVGSVTFMNLTIYNVVGIIVHPGCYLRIENSFIYGGELVNGNVLNYGIESQGELMMIGGSCYAKNSTFIGGSDLLFDNGQTCIMCNDGDFVSENCIIKGGNGESDLAPTTNEQPFEQKTNPFNISTLDILLSFVMTRLTYIDTLMNPGMKEYIINNSLDKNKGLEAWNQYNTMKNETKKNAFRTFKNFFLEKPKYIRYLGRKFRSHIETVFEPSSYMISATDIIKAYRDHANTLSISDDKKDVQKVAGKFIANSITLVMATNTITFATQVTGQEILDDNVYEKEPAYRWWMQIHEMDFEQFTLENGLAKGNERILKRFQEEYYQEVAGEYLGQKLEQIAESYADKSAPRGRDAIRAKLKDIAVKGKELIQKLRSPIKSLRTVLTNAKQQILNALKEVASRTLRENAKRAGRTVAVAVGKKVGAMIGKQAGARLATFAAGKAVGAALAGPTLGLSLVIGIIVDLLVALGTDLYDRYSGNRAKNMFVDTSYSITGMVGNGISDGIEDLLKVDELLARGDLGSTILAYIIMVGARYVELVVKSITFLVDFVLGLFESIATLVSTITNFFFFMRGSGNIRGNYKIEEFQLKTREDGNPSRADDGSPGANGGAGGIGIMVSDVGFCTLIDSNVYGGNGGNGANGTNGSNGGYYIKPHDRYREPIGSDFVREANASFPASKNRMRELLIKSHSTIQDAWLKEEGGDTLFEYSFKNRAYMYNSGVSTSLWQGPPAKDSGIYLHPSGETNGRRDLYFDPRDRNDNWIHNVYTVDIWWRQSGITSFFPLQINMEDDKVTPMYPFLTPNGGFGGNGGNGGNGGTAILSESMNMRIVRTNMYIGVAGIRGNGGRKGYGTRRRQISLKAFMKGIPNSPSFELKSIEIKHIGFGSDGRDGLTGQYDGSNGYEFIQSKGHVKYIDRPITWNQMNDTSRFKGIVTISNKGTSVQSGIRYMYASFDKPLPIKDKFIVTMCDPVRFTERFVPGFILTDTKDAKSTNTILKGYVNARFNLFNKDEVYRSPNHKQPLIPDISSLFFEP
jgi:hypothetical protein